MKRRYRIIGAYDSETTNYTKDGMVSAFPILHQLGILDGTPIEEISADNVESHIDIELFRHSSELYERLDEMVSASSDYVPVICCHNLSFDMYGLSQWLARHDVRVLAKSARKPITFTVLDDEGMPGLVIWDTLIFTQCGLQRMGEDCGYLKAVGEWDYNKVRTPETPLTDREIDYAKKDIYTLIAYLGWWLRRNEDIAPEKLGLNVVTKTGVVRERRKVRFDHVRGKGRKYNIGRYWMYLNRTEMPKSDDELYTMQACTRGGFTFCAAKSASVPYDLQGTGKRVLAFDATSQHPCQMVSHVYPIQFHEASPRVLDAAFDVIRAVKPSRVLAMWEKPFPVAFNGCFEFINLRPKDGTLFARDGVLPLASARYKTAEQVKLDEDNGDKAAHDANRAGRGYVDTVENAVCAFGKLVSADKARLYITELTAYEICQCYDFDSVQAVHGYVTGRFVKPSDMSIVSVMQFYKAKNLYKSAREEYYANGRIEDGEPLRSVGVSPAIVAAMENGTLSDTDIEATYLSLKADLNALFGIEASNEYRRDTVLTTFGIDYTGDFGICNAPKNPKAFYQFGQRIVGWSRIAQITVMQLLEPLCDTFINGDTDSIKVLAGNGALPYILETLHTLDNAIDKAKEKVCARVEKSYPDYFDPLDGIGHYVHEFTSDSFCASWNKAYCTHDVDKRTGERRYSFTLAGIPTSRRSSNVATFIGVNGYADRLGKLGYSFGDVSDLLLGYNVTLANDVIRMNGRKFPEWGTMFFDSVTDYLGNTALVAEPAALALYPMAKTVNDTSNTENRNNMEIAKRNRASVNTESKMVTGTGVFNWRELF